MSDPLLSVPGAGDDVTDALARLLAKLSSQPFGEAWEAMSDALHALDRMNSPLDDEWTPTIEIAEAWVKSVGRRAKALQKAAREPEIPQEATVQDTVAGDVPEVPEVAEPEAPEAEVPAVPAVAEPEAPEAEVPAVPEAEMPTVPAVITPPMESYEEILLREAGRRSPDLVEGLDEAYAPVVRAAQEIIALAAAADGLGLIKMTGKPWLTRFRAQDDLAGYRKSLVDALTELRKRNGRPVRERLEQLIIVDRHLRQLVPVTGQGGELRVTPPDRHSLWQELLNDSEDAMNKLAATSPGEQFKVTAFGRESYVQAKQSSLLDDLHTWRQPFSPGTTEPTIVWTVSCLLTKGAGADEERLVRARVVWESP
ncbi:hypothetical protein [Acrocarpospora catenulata]|uniref:hypothetical protein n=1 Tax=Acrocarpospora catenulata TaxID=2836182 RepID=UPI001BDAFD3F|nr:hypothetical protein [Acrocarpospora catenulata]